MFYGCKQDEFVSKLFPQEYSGTFVDIGSCHPVHSNNTFFLEKERGWRGICIEQNPEYSNYLYKSIRSKTAYYNLDALKINYEKIFIDNNMPNNIDFLSLDIDQSSTLVLEQLPLDKYKFKVITIEHDLYLHGTLYQEKQREILLNIGYDLVFGNVFVSDPSHRPINSPFEDWYLHPDFFDIAFLNKIRSSDIYPSAFFEKF